MNKNIGLFGVTLWVTFVTFTSIVQAAPVLPVFDEDDFSNPTDIDNPWFSLPVGISLEYRGKEGGERKDVQVDVTGDTRRILDVRTLVYRERIRIDGELVSDTRSYLAQDDDGNIWIFGKNVDNFEDGEIDNHDGSWIGGSASGYGSTARPGYWLLADPDIGDEYRRGFQQGVAEDVAEVVSLNATADIDLARYTNCLRTRDTTGLDSDVVLSRYYCRQVHAIVLERNVGENEQMELRDIDRGRVGDDEDDDEDDDRGRNDEARIVALQQRIIALLRQLLTLLFLSR